MSTAPVDPRDVHRTLQLALRAGEVLLSGGVGAAEVTAACTSVAEASGLTDVACDITFTSLSLAGSGGPGLPPVSEMRLVTQRELDYTRVTAVHDLVSELVAGRLDRDAAEQLLREIRTARHPYRSEVVRGARAVLAAAVTLLLGGGWVVAASAIVATLVIDLVNGRLGRGRLPVFYQNVVGGLLATLVAIALVAAGAAVRPPLVVAGGIVLLLPGVTLVGAVQDAITSFYVTASARAFETFLLTTGIISGIAIGLSVGVRLGLPVQIPDPDFTGLGRVPGQLLAAAVVSASFAVANHAPRRTLPVAGLAGAAGWGTLVGVGGLGLSAPIASAAAALVIGAGAAVLGRRQRVPALVHVAAGIVPLLPGLAIYRGLRALAEGDSVRGTALLGSALAVGLALAAGALLGEFLARPPARARAGRERRLAELRWTGPRRRRASRLLHP